ncbi:hypothetical protein PV10_00751 [Exophiala mesophila]|uniref:Peroxin/Ferlin domain-containing protein n=1 Tax=Exophiala mesophila TaxID=212818 RepID=A0A0D2ADG1_EXOME|nr:uncharacterized protein PV10_00751 [Exophiala mesophila]KIV96938.1 hypothetical protein PV10_00751 [Exophiala mesophila]
MSDNVTQTATRVSTLDGAPDPYDHEISLIDATAPDRQEESRSASPSPSRPNLPRNPTKISVKDHLARRKYAKWQEHVVSSKPVSIGTNDVPSSQTPSKIEPGTTVPQSQALDFAGEHSEHRSRKSLDKRKRKNLTSPKNYIYEIDVLYENQRGSFFCGIPLYSNSSLMPIDPSPWLSKDFHQSPVNITNAQVPDPSWEWAWKSWYVDMSYDVDEEGWQYSFAFGRNFAWHGTHPWFHSFVRRRRWLRKRIKKAKVPADTNAGTLGAAHHLTGDYFTIHSKRDRSPISAVDGTGKTARPSSYISYPDSLDVDQPPEDVKNTASLLKALRFASIDRERIDVVKKFVQTAPADELAYVQHHIEDIMSFFVFQNSRRQLLTYLKETANHAREHREKHSQEGRPESDQESRRIDHLLQAIEAANAQITGLEYWSDRKHVLKTVDDGSDITRAIATIFDEPAPKPEPELEPVKEIKGISDQAEITEEKQAKIFSFPPRPPNNDTPNGELDKGKGRAHDSEDDQVEEAPPARLKADQVLIPDEDLA